MNESDSFAGGVFARLFKATEKWLRDIRFILSFQMFLATRQRGEYIFKIIIKQHMVIVRNT